MTKKQKLRTFRTCLGKLEKASKEVPELERTDPLWQLITSLLQHESAPKKAAAAIVLFEDEFVDWNEVRVSAVAEIAEVLSRAGIKHERARELKTVLNKLFVKKNVLSMDFLERYQEKSAENFLLRFDCVHSSVRDEVMLFSLGLPRFPMTEKNHRVCTRIGLVDGEEEDDGRATMLSIVPKTKAIRAALLMTALADSVCKSREPDCSSCVLSADCGYAREKSLGAKPKKKKKKKSTARKKSSKKKTVKKKSGK